MTLQGSGRAQGLTQLRGAGRSTEGTPADSEGADNADCLNRARLFFLAKKKPCKPQICKENLLSYRCTLSNCHVLDGLRLKR